MTPEQKHSVIQAILTFISSILCAITASSCINSLRSLTPNPSPKERGVITQKGEVLDHPTNIWDYPTNIWDYQTNIWDYPINIWDY